MGSLKKQQQVDSSIRSRDLASRAAVKRDQEIERLNAYRNAQHDAAGAIRLPSDKVEMCSETDNEVGAIFWSKAAKRAWATEEVCSARQGDRVIVRELSATEFARVNAELIKDGDEPLTA